MGNIAGSTCYGNNETRYIQLTYVLKGIKTRPGCFVERNNLIGNLSVDRIANCAIYILGHSFGHPRNHLDLVVLFLLHNASREASKEVKKSAGTLKGKVGNL